VSRAVLGARPHHCTAPGICNITEQTSHSDFCELLFLFFFQNFFVKFVLAKETTVVVALPTRALAGKPLIELQGRWRYPHPENHAAALLIPSRSLGTPLSQVDSDKWAFVFYFLAVTESYPKRQTCNHDVCCPSVKWEGEQRIKGVPKQLQPALERNQMFANMGCKNFRSVSEDLYSRKSQTVLLQAVARGRQ
jgi:hypothetical protein